MAVERGSPLLYAGVFGRMLAISVVLGGALVAGSASRDAVRWLFSSDAQPGTSVAFIALFLFGGGLMFLASQKKQSGQETSFVHMMGYIVPTLLFGAVVYLVGSLFTTLAAALILLYFASTYFVGLSVAVLRVGGGNIPVLSMAAGTTMLSAGIFLIGVSIGHEFSTSNVLYTFLVSIFGFMIVASQSRMIARRPNASPDEIVFNTMGTCLCAVCAVGFAVGLATNSKRYDRVDVEAPSHRVPITERSEQRIAKHFG